MMTRKNQVDDLLTRFERKPINQKKCPYCHHGEQGFIKPLIRYTGETGDMGLWLASGRWEVLSFQRMVVEED